MDLLRFQYLLFWMMKNKSFHVTYLLLINVQKRQNIKKIGNHFKVMLNTTIHLLKEFECPKVFHWSQI